MRTRRFFTAAGAAKIPEREFLAARASKRGE